MIARLSRHSGAAGHAPRVDATQIDWVLVPGVAFSADGRRLGYGGGFYDRLMATLPPATPRIAGAFDAQIAERIPAAPHDLRVDSDHHRVADAAASRGNMSAEGPPAGANCRPGQ